MSIPCRRWVLTPLAVALALLAVPPVACGQQQAQSQSQTQSSPPSQTGSAGEPEALEPVRDGAAAAPASAGEGENQTGAETVRFRGEPLFEVRAQLGRLTPRARATAIAGRIEAVVDAGESVLGHIRTEERTRSTEILAGEQHVLSVTDADALPTGRTRQQLAADYTVVLGAALEREFQGRSAKGLIIGAVVTLVATLLLISFIYYLNKLAPRVRTAIRDAGLRYINALKFRGTELLPAASVADGLVQLSRFLQVVLILLATVVYLEAVLSAFPWTTELAVMLRQTLIDAFQLVGVGVLRYVPNVFYIAVILFVTHYLLRFARLFFIALSRGSMTITGFYPEWAMPSFKILRFLTYAFAAVVIFPYLPGSGSPAFQGISLFLGLLFSLGSTSAIANMVAGVVLTYMRPFRDGDRVKIADTIGDIIGKDLLVVRVRTIKNVEVTIPNAMVLNNHIINFSACADQAGLILHTTVTIGYDVPWARVHELLIAAAGRTDGIVAKPAPFVLQTALNDFNVSYELNAYTDAPNRMATIYSALHQSIQDEFNQAGVEIMSPNYIAARDGNPSTIPADHLPKDYNPPSFRILPLGPAR
ncbi:MAG: mechanosensitive ion channel [Gammaproteobacteria bacterium]